MNRKHEINPSGSDVPWKARPNYFIFDLCITFTF